MTAAEAKESRDRLIKAGLGAKLTKEGHVNPNWGVKIYLESACKTSVDIIWLPLKDGQELDWVDYLTS